MNKDNTVFDAQNIFSISLVLGLLSILLFPALVSARVLKVSPDGSQEYVDLRQAFGEAEPGDEIELLAGRYKGGLVIRQNDISIIGQGAEFTRIEAVNEPVISLENASGVLLEGLSLELRSYTGHSTVYAEKSAVEIRNCVVVSTGKAYGIYCVGQTEAKIISNTIVYHQKGGGVNFDGSCFLVIKNNILAFNRFAINNLDETFANPAVSENIFWKNGRNYQGCAPGDGDMVIDPQFVSPLKRDFNLKKGSPAFSLNSQVIGARMDLIEPEFELEPELNLVVEVLDNKDDSEEIFSGDEIELKIVLSNSGAGSGKSLEIKSSVNLPGIRPFYQKIPEIGPESIKIMKYKFTIPINTPDSDLEIKFQLLSAENYQVDPVRLSFGVKALFAKLDLSVEVLDRGNESREIFSGDEIELKIVLSNSGNGPGNNIEIESSANPPGIKPFHQKIPEIGPESIKIMKYKFTIPENTPDSELEIKFQLLSAENYQVDPVLLNFGVKSIFAKLSIETEPEGVEVFLNGGNRGTGPTVIEKLLPGRYELLLKKADYDDEVRPVILGRREEKFIQIALQKSKGNLKVESVPVGADIRINGELKGKTPLTIGPLIVGEYEISARKCTPEMAYTYQGKARIKKGDNSFTIIDFKQHEVPPGMALIPGGEFDMGSVQGEKDERPVHKIYVDSFYIDVYEVSAGKFKKYLQETGQSVREFFSENKLIKDDFPMTGVSWNDAVKYAGWIKKRLPTEAEWELAAKGKSGRKWPWGNDFPPRTANTVGQSDGYPKLAPITAFANGKSEYGVFNMAGNVWEWCFDNYQFSYYRKSPYENPQGPEKGDGYRVLRGGGWSYGRFDARSSNRFRLKPDLRRNYVGMRLVFVPEIDSLK